MLLHQRSKKLGWSSNKPDNTVAEALKSDIEATVNMLRVLFKKICEAEQMLTDWKG